MKTLLLLTCIGCGTTGSSTTTTTQTATASLSVTFGAATPYALAGPVTVSATDTRVVVQIDDQTETVMLSMSRPLAAGQLDVSDSNHVTLWAKQHGGIPDLASTGSVIVTTSDTDSVQIDATKAADSMGVSLAITGTIEGIRE